MVLEHFTVCYKQTITLQNFVSDKFKFIEQNKTTPTDLNICRGFNILMRSSRSAPFLFDRFYKRVKRFTLFGTQFIAFGRIA